MVRVAINQSTSDFDKGLVLELDIGDGTCTLVLACDGVAQLERHRMPSMTKPFDASSDFPCPTWEHLTKGKTPWRAPLPRDAEYRGVASPADIFIGESTRLTGDRTSWKALLLVGESMCCRGVRVLFGGDAEF